MVLYKVLISTGGRFNKNYFKADLAIGETITIRGVEVMEISNIDTNGNKITLSSSNFILKVREVI